MGVRGRSRSDRCRACRRRKSVSALTGSSCSAIGSTPHPEIETLRRPAADRRPSRAGKPSGADNGRSKGRPRHHGGAGSGRIPGWRLGTRATRSTPILSPTPCAIRVSSRAGLRFQVVHAATYRAFGSMFHGRQGWPLLVPGLETATMQAELVRSSPIFPAGHLATPVDCQGSSCVTEQAVVGWTTETPIARACSEHGGRRWRPRHTCDVMLGYNLGFGTLGGWQMAPPKNSAAASHWRGSCRSSGTAPWITIQWGGGAGSRRSGETLNSRRSRAIQARKRGLFGCHSTHGTTGGAHAVVSAAARRIAISAYAHPAASGGSRGPRPD